MIQKREKYDPYTNRWDRVDYPVGQDRLPIYLSIGTPHIKLPNIFDQVRNECLCEDLT